MGCEAEDTVEAVPFHQEETTGAGSEEDFSSPEPRVLAIVNDHQITQEDVERRLNRLGKLYHHSRRPFDERTRRAKKRELVQRLIDQELLREHLNSGDFESEPALVDAELERRVQERFGTMDALRRYLQSEDLTLSDYRHKLREELFIRRLVVPDEEAMAVGEEELRQYYHRLAHQRPAGERVQATILSIRRPAGVDDATARRIAKSLRSSLENIEDAQDFRALVDRIGQGPNTAKMERLRWVERHQVSPAAAKVLFGPQAPESGISPVIETPLGLEVFWIHERRSPGPRGFDELERPLRRRVIQARMEERRRELLKELREQATIAVYLDDEEADEPASSP